MRPTRREFLQASATIAGLAAGLSAADAAFGKEGQRMGDDATVLPPLPTTRKGDMLYRTLGRTGESVSVIGVGGFHIGQVESDDEAVRLVRSAVDRGITFMDNSWDYLGGGSEQRMGQALRDGYRAKVFLMTKIDGRTKAAAAKQIDESLARLQTDHLDLLQHHEVIRLEDPDRIFADDGAQQAIREAQRAGKVRYVGFTGHKDPLVHLRMLEIADAHGVQFDTVQMPLNVMDTHFRSFERQVVPVALRKHIGVLGMKSMGDKVILESKVVTAIECLHYAMSLPTSVVITGIERMEILDQAIEAVRTFKPLTAAQMAALRARTAAAAADGRYELFKTTPRFDSTAKHPEWLG